jgi:hypothetical protein
MKPAVIVGENMPQPVFNPTLILQYGKHVSKYVQFYI